MHTRFTHTARAAVDARRGRLAVAGPASAKTPKRVEPLNQYVVSGKVDTDALARAGFDLREAAVTGKKGKFFIVATPSQARGAGARRARPSRRRSAPRKSFARRRPPRWRSRRTATTSSAPWSLKPAPCPQTCSTPLVNLKTYYHDLAVENPSVVKEEVIGHSVLGQAIMAYKVTQGAKAHAATAAGRRSSTTPPSTRASGSPPRSSAALQVRRRPQVQGRRRDQAPAADARAVVRPGRQPRRLRLHVRQQGHAPVAQEPARRQRRRLHRQDADGVDTNRNWPTNWNYDLEGASDDPSHETYHGTGPASEPEVRRCAGSRSASTFKFPIDYHSFAQLILYPEGWQVETLATDSPLMAALAGDDDNPAVAGLRPRRLGRALHDQRRRHRRRLATFGTQAYTVELDGGTGPASAAPSTDPTRSRPAASCSRTPRPTSRPSSRRTSRSRWTSRARRRPREPVSHLGNTARTSCRRVPDSYGDPQTVEVNAKKSLGDVPRVWQVNDGACTRRRRTEFTGGARYGDDPGIYYHHMRGTGHGDAAGDSVEVWFTAERPSKSTRSPTRWKNEQRQQGAAAGGRGLHRAAARRRGPERRPAVPRHYSRR